MPLRKYIIIALIALSLMPIPVTAQAQHRIRPTPQEMLLLPEYCKVRLTYKQDTNSPYVIKWMKILGKENYIHMHHYCFGLTAAQRADSPEMSDVDRKGNLKRAISELEYVMTRATPNFVLWPDLYSNYGRIQLLLGNTHEADVAFQRANKKSQELNSKSRK